MARRTTTAVLIGIFILVVSGVFDSLGAGSTPAHSAGSQSTIFNDEPPTATPTNTSAPPTATATHTAVPTNTATATFTATATNTPVVPTPTSTTDAGPTDTPIPINTSTPTNTPLPQTPTSTSTPVSAAPQLDLNGSGAGVGYQTYYLIDSGGAVKIVSNELSITADRPNLVSATIKIANPKDGSSERINVNTLDTNINVDASSDGILLLSGTDSVFNYQRVLRTTTYRNSASNPNTTTRRVTFVVNDGFQKSNSPTSRVIFVEPIIEINKEPELQTIALGDSAEFTVEVRNIGNVTLNDVTISDSMAPECEQVISSLDAGAKKTVSCRVSNVATEFTNVAEVTAKDDFGNTVSAQDSARVEVLNPNIQIVKSPSRQTILKGTAARFDILVVNTSKGVDLKEVAVVDPLVPSCNKQIGNLKKQDQVIYSCEQSNVTAPLTNEATVSGRNVLNNDIVSDSSIAEVQLLDMEVSLVANPPILDLNGGLIEFGVTIRNSGSVPFLLQSMVMNEFGAIDDPNNSSIKNNSCSDAQNAEIDAGDSYFCSFVAELGGSPGTRNYLLEVSARDEDRNKIDKEATATVIIAELDSLEVTLEAEPASIPAPGGLIKERIRITNLTNIAQINLNTLIHSELGNLAGLGDCTLPQNIVPQGSYSCQIETIIEGASGDYVTHSVYVSGVNSFGTAVGGSAQADILLFNSAKQQKWMPVVAKAELHPEEDNDSPCQAFPIEPGREYHFAVDDAFDWYYFDVERPGMVTVRISNLMSKDSQAAVYANDSCDDLDGAADLVAYNGDNMPEKILKFEAEKMRHFLVIADIKTRSLEIPYKVIVLVP